MSETQPQTEGLFTEEELLALKQLQSEADPTLDEMFAHLENYVTDLKKQKDIGKGEPWMDEHIRIEEGIIKFLKTVALKVQVNFPELSPERVIKSAQQDSLI